MYCWHWPLGSARRESSDPQEKGFIFMYAINGEMMFQLTHLLCMSLNLHTFKTIFLHLKWTHKIIPVNAIHLVKRLPFQGRRVRSVWGSRFWQWQISVMKVVQVTLDLDIINFKMFKNKRQRSIGLCATNSLTVYIRVPTRS